MHEKNDTYFFPSVPLKRDANDTSVEVFVLLQRGIHLLPHETL